MSSPKIARDIANYLITTVGLTDVSVGKLNPSPINQYAVIVYPGLGSVKVHGSDGAGKTKTLLEQVRIQIQVRNKNDQDALTAAHAVKDAIDGLFNITISGTVYTHFMEVSPIRILTVEESSAVIYIWEMQTQAIR